MTIEEMVAQLDRDIDEAVKEREKMSRMEKYADLRAQIEAENEAHAEEDECDCEYCELCEYLEKLENENEELKLIILKILHDLYL